ncbi:uncharacterized protein [Antedon mediterranea]
MAMTPSLKRCMNDEEYKNWIKLNHGLMLLNKSVYPYCEKEITNFHEYLKKSIDQKCSSCEAGENTMCESCIKMWTAEIESKLKQGGKRGGNKKGKKEEGKKEETKEKKIEWSNVNKGYWRTYNWEVAKAYMNHGQTPKLKYEPDTSSLFSLMRNCNLFKIKDDRINKICFVRNKVMHSGMTVSTENFRHDLNVIEGMLNTVSTMYKHDPETIKTIKCDYKQLLKLDFEIIDGKSVEKGSASIEQIEKDVIKQYLTEMTKQLGGMEDIFNKKTESLQSSMKEFFEKHDDLKRMFIKELSKIHDILNKLEQAAVPQNHSVTTAGNQNIIVQNSKNVNINIDNTIQESKSNGGVALNVKDFIKKFWRYTFGKLWKKSVTAENTPDHQDSKCDIDVRVNETLSQKEAVNDDCGRKLLKKNSSIHCQRGYDERAKQNLNLLPTVCVDKEEGIFAVHKNEKSAHPIHVVKRTIAKGDMPMNLFCEVEECMMAVNLARYSGITSFECIHLLSVADSEPHRQQGMLSKDKLLELSQSQSQQYSKEILHSADALNQAARTCAKCSVYPISQMTEDNTFLFFSVYCPTVSYYNKVKRVIVHYKAIDNSWNCKCPMGERSCVHKVMAKWYMLESAPQLLMKTLTTPTQTEQTSKPNASNYPPPTAMKRKMVSYWLNNASKRIPYPVPKKFTQVNLNSLDLVPTEIRCSQCPGNPTLGLRKLITSHASIITMHKIIKGKFMAMICSNHDNYNKKVTQFLSSNTNCIDMFEMDEITY